MSRSIEFDRDDILEKYMQVFWSFGYDQTTVRNLVKATGLKPGSLCGAFSSKHLLFQHSLARYQELIDQRIANLLPDDYSPVEAVRNFFTRCRVTVLRTVSSGDVFLSTPF